MLTPRELNRALLARQLLLQRANLPVNRALERVAGLQAQEPAPPFVGLWARLAGFERDSLKRALFARTAVRATLMRGTIHLVSARDYTLLAPATQAMIQALWRRYLRDRGDVADIDEVTARATAYAAQPRTASELRQALGGDDAWWRARRHGLFVHAPDDSAWSFGRRPRYVAAPSWLARPLETVEAGRRHLVRRYLAAFGPAATDDLATWSGLAARDLLPTLDRLPLRHFRDEQGRRLLDLPRAPLPRGETPAPARLLPAFDSAILSRRDRRRILPDDYRGIVIRGGIVDPVFLVDGLVAGRWHFESARVVLEPFAPLARRVREDLRHEADRLAAFAA